MARSWRTPNVLWLLTVAGAFVPLFAGLVDSAGRRPHSRPELPPLVEVPDASHEPELCLAIVPPAEEPEEPARAPAKPASPAPAAFARITGIVLRLEGEPAVGARVVLGKQEARCDDAGRFVLEPVAAAPDADLVAIEPGFEPAVRPFFGANLPRGSESEARLVLGPPTLTLSGRVVDRAGNPLKGWHVELDELDLLASLGLREDVLTDDAGDFQICDVPAGVHVVRAWRIDGGVSVRSRSVGAGSIGLVLVVEQPE